MVDPAQLELALLNIASNARDAMPDGGRLSISITFADQPAQGQMHDPGPQVCLAVVDTGEGMDEETLSRAADPFFTTKGPGKGIGLGLSVVHGVLEESQGRLVLKSTRGAGTTVEMWFPVAPDQQPSQAAPQSRPIEAERNDKALTVLAVDDDALVLMNTVIMLEDLGYKVIEAGSGADALVALGNHEIDLMITDHAMPHMSGTELAEAARLLRPGLPVIIATGFLNLPAGAAPLDMPKLLKPFGLEQLRATVCEAIQNKR